MFQLNGKARQISWMPSLQPHSFMHWYIR